MSPFSYLRPLSPKTISTLETQFWGFTVKVEFKRIRHTYLRIEKDGQLKISTPVKYQKLSSAMVGLTSRGEALISNFIYSKRNWIFRRSEKLEKSPSPQPLYQNNSYIDFLGNKIILVIIPSSKNIHRRCRLTDASLHIDSSDTSPESIQAIVEGWQREELRRRIALYSQKWEKVMGLKAEEYRIRKMKTRWGTCNPAAKRIWLSLSLIEKPEICLEYVLVHELVHFWEKRHNHRFKNLMNHFLPKWREYRKLLNMKVRNTTLL